MSEPGPENRELFKSDGAPDWDAVTFDVLCSRCGYNLRTLTRPKCTECGLEFEWRQVITAKANESDFLFEHQWRRRPIQSFLITVWRSLRPRKFWSSVSIHQDIQEGPLWFLIILAPLIFWGLAMGSSWALAAGIEAMMPPFAANLRTMTPFKWWLLEIASPFERVTWHSSRIPVWAYLPIAATVWIPLVASGVALSELRQTLARLRILKAHMLRVTAYCAIPTCICSAYGLLVNMWAVEQIPYFHPMRISLFTVAVGPLIAVLVFAYYLRAGLKYYLGLSRAGRIAISVALIGQLVLLNYLVALMWLTTDLLRWFPPIMPFFS